MPEEDYAWPQGWGLCTARTRLGRWWVITVNHLKECEARAAVQGREGGTVDGRGWPQGLCGLLLLECSQGDLSRSPLGRVLQAGVDQRGHRWQGQTPGLKGTEELG